MTDRGRFSSGEQEAEVERLEAEVKRLGAEAARQERLRGQSDGRADALEGKIKALAEENACLRRRLSMLRTGHVVVGKLLETAAFASEGCLKEASE